MRTIAIGDIHGCLTALQTLLEVINLAPDDRLIFLGDYVDRGPNSRGVIEKLIQLSQVSQHVFLRGNHDQWMLSARYNKDEFRGWESVGGYATLDSYEACTLDDVPSEHFDWQQTTRYFFQTETHIFVHGSIGYDPPHKTSERVLLWQRIYGIEEHPSGKFVICGHTAQGDGRVLDLGHAICIDTCCCGGKWLTGLDVESDQVFQANEQGATQIGTLKELGKTEV